VGREALILDEVAGTHRVGTMPSVGTRWPAHAASTGKAILAFLPVEQQAAFLRGRLPALTSRTITEPGAFRRELARVSGRGWSLNAEELEEGFVAVGAPVRSGDGRVTAAISVGGPRARLLPEKVAELARLVPAAAARISQRLGATQAPPPRTSNRKART
jgi:DNA-binding IclR family transcriptional regulator